MHLGELQNKFELLFITHYLYLRRTQKLTIYLIESLLKCCTYYIKGHFTVWNALHKFNCFYKIQEDHIKNKKKIIFFLLLKKVISEISIRILKIDLITLIDDKKIKSKIYYILEIYVFGNFAPLLTTKKQSNATPKLHKISSIN